MAMIFGSLIRRAEDAVENILDQALARVIIAIPLLIAAGFATASGSVFLNARYGPETGNLIMAGVFAAIGLVAAGYVAARSPGSAAAGSEQAAALSDVNTAESDSGSAPSSSASPLTSSERELLTSLLGTAAPIAVPGLVRLLLRNIPLLIALAAAIFIMTRSGDEATATAGESPQV